MINIQEKLQAYLEPSQPAQIDLVLNPYENPAELKYWTYPHARLIVCQKGEMVLRRPMTNGSEKHYHLKAGEAIFVDADCYAKSSAGEFDHDEYHFEPSSFMLSSFQHIDGMRKNFLYSQDLPAEKLIELENYRQLMINTMALETTPALQAKRICYAKLMLFTLLESLEKEGEESTDGKSSATFRTTLSYIDGNYCFDITRTDVAKEMGVSEGHITYLFKKWTGQSFKDFLTLLRMEQFRTELIGRGAKIKEVYKGYGIKDANYFTQIFRRMYGISSRELKNWATNEPDNLEEGIRCNQTAGFKTIKPETAPSEPVLPPFETTRTTLFANLSQTPCRIFTDAPQGKRLRLLTVHPGERRWSLIAPGQNIYVEKGNEESFYRGQDHPSIIFLTDEGSK